MELLGALAVAVSASVFGWWLAHRFSRRIPKDALEEHILVQVNDDMRKVFVAMKKNYRPRSGRVILDSGSEFLIDEVIEVREATVKLRYVLVGSGGNAPYRFGVAVFRLPSIAFVEDGMGDDSKRESGETDENEVIE